MAKRHIPGTRILTDGRREIFVFVEKSIDGKKKRHWKTEITDLTTVKDIRIVGLQ